MLDMFVYLLIVLGKVVLWTLAVSTVGTVGYVYLVKDWIEYRKAKKDIVAFINGYKRRCTGNNRFVVTVETLQDSFREYDIEVIGKVWQDLVTEHVIVSDPQDQVWCIR